VEELAVTEREAEIDTTDAEAPNQRLQLTGDARE